jgi:hypothetical protein
MDAFFCTSEGLELKLAMHYHLPPVNISGSNKESILGAPRIRYMSSVVVIGCYNDTAGAKAPNVTETSCTLYEMLRN